MLLTIVGLIANQSAMITVVFFCILFRKQISKRQAWLWFILTFLTEFISMGIAATWPNLPNVYEGMLPFFILNSLMLRWVSKLKLVNVVPILIIFNALGRFVGGVIGLLVELVLTPGLTIYTHSITSQYVTLNAELNQMIAMIFAFAIFIPLAFFASDADERFEFVSRLRKIRVDGFDYTLVSIYFIFYFISLQIVMQEKLQLQTQFTFLLGIVLGTFYYYLVLSRFEQLTNDQLIENLRGYDASVSRMNEEMHRFSHDYQNVLLGLSYFVKRSNDVELQKYFAQVTKDSNNRFANMGTGDIERLRYLNSGYIKGLIYSKLLLAEKNKIKFSVLINQEIKLREEQSVDLVRIFGNVIDNAIDAAKESDQVVRLSAVPSEQVNLFEVRNTIPSDQKLDISHASKIGVTTKEGHMGIGMNNIRRLAKQGIEVEQVIDDQQFITTIKVPSDTSKTETQ